MHILKTLSLAILPVSISLAVLHAQQLGELPFPNSDFEFGDLTNWTASGEAFKCQPTWGDNTEARKRESARMQGQFWIGTHENNPKEANRPGRTQGDKPRGKLVSQEFPITHKYLTFLIGGGSNPQQLYVEILVDGKPVKRKTGGNSETMRRDAVDLRAYQGKTARIRIVDQDSRGWGHINADDFRWSDDDSVLNDLTSASVELDGGKKYLLIPVANPKKKLLPEEEALLTLYADGQPVQTLKAYLPKREEDIAWWASYPIDRIAAQSLRLDAEGISPSQKAIFQKVRTSNEQVLSEEDYREPYRNQFHFSQRRGWNNDINGLYYRDGLWHLFWQYNPLGTYWQNMHWGHAVSKDLVHWEERDIALFQNGVKDMMFSGTGFVDKNNTSKLDPSGRGADFLAFTSTGRGECLAYSLDGGNTWKEVDYNPVVKHNGRDPKVFWHEPSKKWIMIVFDSQDEALKPKAELPFRRKDLESRNHEGFNFAIYSSSNLKDWTLKSRFTMPDRSTVYECPELIELPIEGEPGQTKWVTFGVMQFYYIGDFDGKTFKPMYEASFTGMDILCRAGIVFDNAPDNRKIMIGWTGQDHSSMCRRWPDLKFCQGMTVPLELSLRRTPDGLKMIAYPVKELEQLRGKPLIELKNPSFEQAQSALESLNGSETKYLDILIEYAQKPGAKLSLLSDGQGPDSRGEFHVFKDGQPFTPSQQGELRMLVDSTLIDCYLDKGLRSSLRRKPIEKIGTTNLSLQKEGDVQIKSLTVYPMGSIWEK